MTEPTTELVIVEDHGLLGHTVAAALRVRGRSVVLLDPRTSDVVAEVERLRPRLVLLDLDLGDAGDATDLIPALTAAGAAVLMVTGVTDPVRRARCIAAGAVGVVDKASTFDTLLDAVDRVQRDGTLLTKHERDEQLARLRASEQERRDRLTPFDALSPREAEVLGQLVQGLTVDQIAKANVVSIATVRSQVRAILSKLGVGTQIAAVARAREADWTGPDVEAT